MSEEQLRAGVREAIRRIRILRDTAQRRAYASSVDDRHGYLNLELAYNIASNILRDCTGVEVEEQQPKETK